MGLIHDPEAEKRSLMMAQKALCNGQQTGRSCVHYWVHAEKVESNNPDNLRIGEVFRVCAPMGTSPTLGNEMSESQLATRCNRYEPRKLPLFKRALKVLGLPVDDPGVYDPEVEEYNPLTAEEIRLLQEGSSDPTAVAERGPLTPGTTAPLTGDDAVADLKKEVAISLQEARTALEAESATDNNTDKKDG
jgi:hypothetical protein